MGFVAPAIIILGFIVFVSIGLVKFFYFRIHSIRNSGFILPALASAFISWILFAGFAAFITFSVFLINEFYHPTFLPPPDAPDDVLLRNLPLPAQNFTVFVGVWGRLLLPPNALKACPFTFLENCHFINQMVWNNWIGYFALIGLGVITFFIARKRFRKLDIFLYKK